MLCRQLLIFANLGDDDIGPKRVEEYFLFACQELNSILFIQLKVIQNKLCKLSRLGVFKQALISFRNHKNVVFVKLKSVLFSLLQIHSKYHKHIWVLFGPQQTYYIVFTVNFLALLQEETHFRKLAPRHESRVPVVDPKVGWVQVIKQTRAIFDFGFKPVDMVLDGLVILSNL